MKAAIACSFFALAVAAPVMGQGVLREVWTNLSGTMVADLVESPHYPANPILRVVDASFASPINWRDNYGVRMRALLTPTAARDYTFWVAGDNDCELWLGTDATPATRRRIATVPGITGSRTWTTYPAQKSAPITLAAGQRYYIEAVMKEGTGSDSLAVAWATSPTGTPEVIPGSVLTPYEVPAATVGTLQVKAGQPFKQYAPNMTIALSAMTLDTASPTRAMTVQWSQVSGSAASIKTPSLADTQVVLPATGTYVFKATATGTGGSVSDNVTVTLLPKLATDAGTALAEYWFGVTGTTLAELAASPDYPGHPHAHRLVTSLASPPNVGDYFGERVRGFILAPTTGNYNFYVSADSSAELLLSPDDKPANLVSRATVATATLDPFSTSAQASGPVAMVAGKRYAFELRHKEHNADDHATVMWSQPGSEYAAVVSMEYLAPPTDNVAALAATQEFKLDSDYVLNAGRNQCLYLPQQTTTLSAYEWRRYSGPDTPVRTWSVVSGPAGAVIAAPGLASTSVSLPKVGTYVLRYSVATVRNTTTDDVVIEVKAALTANTGSLTRQVWWNRNFASLTAVRADAAFPNFPDIVDTIPALRQGSDWADLYATRVTGLLRLPASTAATKDYTFYVSGDEEVEFSISTDATPANLRKVCFTTRSSGRDNFRNEASQASTPITLKPGGSYYVELVHREVWSSDYFSVAWSKAGDNQLQIIDGSYFEPTQKVAPFSATLNYYAYAGKDRTYYMPQASALLNGSTIRAHSTTGTVTTTWRKVSGPASTIENPSALTTGVTFSGLGAYVYELTANEAGVLHTDTVTYNVIAALPGVGGYLTRSVWLDVNGTQLTDLTTYDPTLTHPHFEDLLPGIETPRNWADQYGQRLKGYLTVPITGSYKFWIASDDQSELKLDQLDGNGLLRIGYTPYGVGYQSWTSVASQASVAITLTAGRAYPIEVLHKEYSDSDYVSVAMDGPATNGREVISRAFLSPDHPAAAFNPEITVSLGPDRSLLWPVSTLTIAALVYDLKPGPNALTYRWSSTSTRVSFDAATSPVSPIRFAGPGTYEIKMTASDGTNTSADTMIVTVRDPLTTAAGGIVREAWTNVPGYGLVDLRNSSAYAGSPTFTDLLSSFEAPTNWGDNYGQRLTGLFQVPTEGDYVLLIASDDESELWLNTTATSETAAGATKIAWSPYASGRYQWSARASQQSATVHLVPGKRYYIQALHKEGGGDDCLAVAYRLATQTNAQAMVIPGSLLSPLPTAVGTAAIDGQISVEAGENIEGYWPHARYALRGTAVDYFPGPQPLAYRWGVSVAPAGKASLVVFDSPTALATNVEFPVAGVYELLLSATDGVTTRLDKLSVTINAALGTGTGSILAEKFNSITGGWVTDLTRNAKYPNSPDERTQLTKLEIPANQGDNYGMVVRGYIHPPTTGVYRFNIASDEWSECYISTDRTPENKAMACFVPSATNLYEWRRYPDYQLSRPITLTKGLTYYIELRMKESGYSDHLELAWLRPGSSAFEVIDGAFLEPVKLADVAAPTIALTGGNAVTINVGATYTDLGFTATDGTDGDLSARVRVDGTVDTTTPGTYTLRYTVTDAAGNVSSSTTRRVTVALAAGSNPTYPADTSASHSTAPWVAPATLSDADAVRFLKQATFGPTDADIARVKSIGIAAWINEQLALPSTLHLPAVDNIAKYQDARTQLLALAKTGAMLGLAPGSMAPSSSIRTDDRLWTWWTTALTAPDQLRQRIAFTLSEIFVIADGSTSALRNYPRGVTNYYDILVNRSTGNYRDLLEDVTFNPMMGTWLTMVRNNKAKPDENYAREIMQLFSIGIDHLNTDGTFKRDGSGNAIPTYHQAEIVELARAFTGWTYGNSPSFTYGGDSWDQLGRMMPFEAYHDRNQKVILGGATLPPGQTAKQDVIRSLDIIAAHPNVGPFMAKRLIQRLVTSNPSADYVFRVASKFNNNGSGVRGDLAATVKAVLLDPEARTASSDTNFGKLAEPILRLSRLLRAYPVAPSTNPPTLGRYLLTGVIDGLSQSPVQSPTVFNFFHTNFAPQGPILDADLVAPEFEITTELSVTDSSNYFYDGVTSGFSASGTRATLNKAPLLALWATPDTLLTQLQTKLLGRPMSANLRTQLQAIITANGTDASGGVTAVLQALVATPEFAVDR